ARYDPLSPQERSERMSRVRSSDTGPEWIVRSTVHKLGFRYRLHSPDLPGRPDLVFRSRNKAIFVHGCFWHQHGCHSYRMPKTRRGFWQAKLEKNVLRDKRNTALLRRQGWRVLVLWECQLKNSRSLQKRLLRFL